MAEELSTQLCCVKYSLMACNAFGIMLGIFVVLFGLAYPEENFPVTGSAWLCATSMPSLANLLYSSTF